MTKRSTASNAASSAASVPDFVPEDTESVESDLPYVSVASVLDRNLIFWNVIAASDRPGYNNGPARETWILEVSADDADAPTNVMYVNQTALVKGLTRIPAFPTRVRITRQTGKSGTQYYNFVKPE